MSKPPRNTADGTSAGEVDRGCVFFTFGHRYALRLLVAVASLRRVYAGPITTFVIKDAAGAALKGPLEQLGSDVIFLDGLSKSSARHRLFYESPYRTTLVFDSDLLFVAPIDALWEPLERDGVLVTRFYPPPHGVDDSGWPNRVQLLKGVRHLVDGDTYAEALRRQLDERIDINVGVMGISRPRGDAFLHDYAERIEKGRSANITLLDEMLALALLPKHHHFLADEKWNCPADEFFRRTNLGDACVIHYFADGSQVRGMRLGRNPATWAGQKWYAAHELTGRSVDLAAWERSDPAFTGPQRRAIARTTSHALSLGVKPMLVRARVWLSSRCDRVARRLLRRGWLPLQQLLLSALFRVKYRVPLHAKASATVIILSYKRMRNISRIVRSVLLCDFVDRVIVCNNNPDVDLRPYVPERDARLDLLQQNTRQWPSYRYELARDCPSSYYICIDDDVFPTPWQLRKLFTALLRKPDAPVCSAGQIWDRGAGRLRSIKHSPWSRRRRPQSRPVHALMQMHAFTREHLERYFRLVEEMGIENAAVHSSEDVIVSFAGRTRPKLQDVGYVAECPTAYDLQIATHGRDGFVTFRHHLFDRLEEAHALDTGVRDS
jgi:hypothetical protein